MPTDRHCSDCNKRLSIFRSRLRCPLCLKPYCRECGIKRSINGTTNMCCSEIVDRETNKRRSSVPSDQSDSTRSQHACFGTSNNSFLPYSFDKDVLDIGSTTSSPLCSSMIHDPLSASGSIWLVDFGESFLVTCLVYVLSVVTILPLMNSGGIIYKLMHLVQVYLLCRYKGLKSFSDVKPMKSRPKSLSFHSTTNSIASPQKTTLRHSIGIPRDFFSKS